MAQNYVPRCDVCGEDLSKEVKKALTAASKISRIPGSHPVTVVICPYCQKKMNLMELDPKTQ